MKCEKKGRLFCASFIGQNFLRHAYALFGSILRKFVSLNQQNAKIFLREIIEIIFFQQKFFSPK